MKQRVLGLIPARGGSKGVPRKNIRPLAGKPLIAWTIAAALACESLDRLILSSEDPEIIAVSQKWGCEAPFVRPADLARDDTPGIAPVLHALTALPETYDLVALLQPTSPLRLPADIDAAVRLCLETNAPACVSVVVPDKSPYWMFTRDEGGRLRPLLPQTALPARRQDIPPAYCINGAVYVARVPWLLERKTFLAPETVGYVMPKQRSLDIDDALDFTLSELILNARSLP